MDEKIGDNFQKKTKYSRFSIGGGGLDWISKPELYKTYPNSKKIKLERPKKLSKISFFETLEKRKSIRNFSTKPITKEELSYLLWTTTGINRKDFNFEFRTAPSAGALYPIETYLIINKVEEIPEGLYHYSIKDHALEELKLGDFRTEIANAALGQNMCAEAAVVFIWTAIFERSKWKYNQRGYRYIYLDAGHIGHNLALSATSLNLGSCQIAALFDDEVNELIGVDGKDESTVYMSVVGNKTLGE
jgi:SagB-type dehydrogenase family enzyme